MRDLPMFFVGAAFCVVAAVIIGSFVALAAYGVMWVGAWIGGML